MRSIKRVSGEYKVQFELFDEDLIEEFKADFSYQTPRVDKLSGFTFYLDTDPYTSGMLRKFGERNGFKIEMEMHPSNVIKSVPSRRKE